MRQKLIIADDNRAITEVLKLNFDLLGYEVFVAADGEEAEALFRRVKPALMILDVMMPRKNGYQVCRDLKRDPELMRIPIVLLTAKSLKEDVYWGYDCGADAYVTKPYDPHQLELLVDQLIREAASGSRTVAWTGLPDSSKVEAEFRARLEAGAPALLLEARLLLEGREVGGSPDPAHRDLLHQAGWMLHEAAQEAAQAAAVGQTAGDRFWVVLSPGEAEAFRARAEERLQALGPAPGKLSLAWETLPPPRG
jgi:DNA-binding response OmpR family regulator